MKTMIKQKILAALNAFEEKTLDFNLEDFIVEEPKDPNHGHLATNAAMSLSKILKKNPRVLAEELIKKIDNHEGYLEKMEIAGPGFINFTLSNLWWSRVLKEILDLGTEYGRGKLNDCKVLLEFVSANPTGPLHVGHGRGAAIGDALARIMKYAGYQVSTEYYINDAGTQMNILGASVYERLMNLLGEEKEFPDNHYRGAYIIELADKFLKEQGEAYIKSKNSSELKNELKNYAGNAILADIKNVLLDFKVDFNVWFSESSLFTNSEVEAGIKLLKEAGHCYEQDGALWFASEKLGDDKNRVLIKSNGELTYFTSDISYHLNKFNRGFNLLIDVWGADHHGYIPRVKAAIKALNYEENQLAVVLVQLVSLLRNGQPVQMSTRAGEFVTLKELIDEVGSDAARFIFLTRSSDSPLDFDLEIAKSKTRDNPVYYVQYVGARIESILKEAGLKIDADLSLLAEYEEIALIKHMSLFAEILENAAKKREPYILASYLTALAKFFHHYYSRHRIISDDQKLTASRLHLIKAVRQIVKKGLELLGVSSPDSM